MYCVFYVSMVVLVVFVICRRILRRIPGGEAHTRCGNDIVLYKLPRAVFFLVGGGLAQMMLET